MSASSSGSKDTLDRIERMRSKAVYRSMLKLLDNDGVFQGTETVHEEKLWKNTRCMSGAEFELAIEERILGGYCGYPGCCRDVDDNFQGYCSEVCVQGVKRHVGKLGTTEAAMKRFTSLYELAKKERNLQLGKQQSVDRSSVGRAKEGGLAAGTNKMPIMQAVVKERNPVNAPDSHGTASYDAEAVEGYRVSSKSGVSQKKVHFADTVEVEKSTSEAENSRASFVFEIEDPKGPIEDDLKSLGDTFGTLRVVSEESQSAGIDTELARTVREGASRCFPHLQSCLPKEIWESSLGTTSDSEHDDDDDDDTRFLTDEDLASDDEDTGDIKCHMTFFTQLFSFFDMWITDYTIEIISGTRIIPLDEERKSTPQVPEVMTAMQSFISIGCKNLTTSLQAERDTKTIGDDVSKIIYSFRMDHSLPAFQSKQWVVVCLVILKALSLTARPEYQEYTDTREGIVRVGKILSAANFTVEEMYAVLDLFVYDTT